MVKKQATILTFAVIIMFLAVSMNTFASYPYGGSGDGYDLFTMSTDFPLGGPQVTIASGANQVFTRGAGKTAISMITITDDSSTPGITTANSIKVSIPASFYMTWDETDLNATFGGSAAGKVGAISYADANKTLVIAVTANFAASDTLTISNLSFQNFLASGADNLELDFDSDGLIDALDGKTITIAISCSYGGSEDGWDSDTMSRERALCLPGTMIIIR